MAANDTPPGIRKKLVETKQAWAREGRLLTGQAAPPEQRLPPGQRLVTDFPVLDLGIQPAVSRETFRLKLDGLVENPVTLDWAWLQELPQEDRLNDIHCVTQWSRYDNHWRGVPVAAILDLARLKPGARFVSFEAHDGYTTNLTLEDFARPENLLAHSWEGAPLTRQHGGPLRVLVPHLYLWKSTKWVRRISFLAKNAPGFWEERGYHDRGDPWMEERYG
ncbi:sulfite oxidase-like oxidoreductase [Pseudoroseomonas deserti]|uniref:Sulfite oxidase-like oxidoreductase n=1 Tax=Teichococcus deserti TaxID=1817963 RepID=A0A1V2H512_9PROT|nr:sulfite oxidase-like oxidoreductase [Pseudoroseomonas deserti]ONG55523.1 sulfite oxidase-like oxidoreductase [Pseudoroseomonas deserti]